MIDEIVQTIDRMPRISNITLLLLDRLMDENFTVSEVAKLIEPDVSLSSRLLQTVNSPFFGLSRKITSIRLAVTFFGRLNMLSLIIMEGFKDIFYVPMRLYERRPGEFWEHSLKTALAAKALAEWLPAGVNTDVAYTAGLLHDMGKVCISKFAEENLFIQISELFSDFNLNLLEQERKYFQVDHTIVGEALADKWNLPDYVCMAVRFHHHPQMALGTFRYLSTIVYLANMMAKFSTPEALDDSILDQMNSIVASVFLKKDFPFEKILLKFEEEFKKTRKR